ncbi:actin-binding LIM protein 1 isoform X17 [Saccopteryx leptura]|uniref:actin-binding LIM protein 1 isoform X17 n=1 Tax=Saccopteryx leptura TaxID=249018 RepID=UPI00339C4933
MRKELESCRKLLILPELTVAHPLGGTPLLESNSAHRLLGGEPGPSQTFPLSSGCSPSCASHLVKKLRNLGVLCTSMAWEPAELMDPDPGLGDNQVAHPQDPHHPSEKPVIHCHKCGEPCKGEVLRVQTKHFHIKCFTCKVCGCDLAQGGFFIKNGEYLCTLDYQRMYGTRCHGCGEFVEGEVVTALGKTYHPNCFACTICKRPFPPGDRVTFNGRDCLCQLCAQPMSSSPKEASCSGNCAGCGRDIKNGQALLALDKQWHLGCFKCKSCGKVLTGEYISKDGAPYCEKDYQGLFGVKCEACHQFITGKVLEAGDKHYHPSCARCSRCNQMFTEGEEMYLQGSTVWHPDCKQSTKTEEKLRPPNIRHSASDFFYPKSLIRRTGRSPSLQPTRTSSESIYSRPGSSIPGSPGHTIYAKVDNEILDYKDLAAIPKVKAIYDIERPDLITYEPFYTSGYDDKQERQSLGESPRTLSPTPSAEGYQDVRDRMIHRSTSQGSINSPVYSRHSYTPTTSRSPQHFHRPGADTRRRSSGREEDDEELLRRRQLQEEQLMKLNSGLGQLILKEEMEREGRERSSLSASRYDSPINSGSHVLSSKTSSLPGYGRNGLHRPISTDFAQYNSYGDVSGGVRDYQVRNTASPGSATPNRTAIFQSGCVLLLQKRVSVEKLLIWVDPCDDEPIAVRGLGRRHACTQVKLSLQVLGTWHEPGVRGLSSSGLEEFSGGWGVDQHQGSTRVLFISFSL